MLAEFESGTLAQYLELIKAGEIKNQQLNAPGVLDHALHASGLCILRLISYRIKSREILTELCSFNHLRIRPNF